MSILDQPWCALEVANVGDGSTPAGYQPWLLEGGWAAAAERYARCYERGFRVLMVHRPFGEPDPGDVMDADALVEAQAIPQAAALANGFPAWTAELRERFPQTELVAYLGSFQDADFQALDRHDPAGWWGRAHASFAPLLGLEGVHLGFDHAGSYDPGGRAYRFIRDVRTTLHQRGRLGVFEPLPVKGHNEDTDWPCYLITENSYHQNLHGGLNDKLILPDAPIVRWWNGSSEVYAKSSGWAFADFHASAVLPRYIPCVRDDLIERHELRVTTRAVLVAGKK